MVREHEGWGNWARERVSRGVEVRNEDAGKDARVTMRRGNSEGVGGVCVCVDE